MTIHKQINIDIIRSKERALAKLKHHNEQSIYYYKLVNTLEKQLSCKHTKWKAGAQAGMFGGYDIEVCCECGYERCY